MDRSAIMLKLCADENPQDTRRATVASKSSSCVKTLNKHRILTEKGTF